VPVLKLGEVPVAEIGTLFNLSLRHPQATPLLF